STGGEQPATPPAGDHNLAASQSRHDARTKEAVRVDRDRLDKLINAIGDLVIADSMVQQEISSLIQGDMHMLRSLPLMAKISRELQEQSLSLRMVPLSSTFQKVGRMVRDLGKKLKKEIEFVAEGADTELDKSVVDMLGDPLVHMVRNSADHGIETGEERVANGKRPQARITLRAYHQSGNTYLELEDDGRGLNRERILAKAIERGLVRTTDTLTDEEVYELIFQPGFSTAAVVTDVSGRGVGLDVVRRNIEALRGGVQIRSRPGQGTVFTLRLPLTLASIDGLAVCLNGELYIIPMGSVIESVRPKSGSVRTVCGRGEVVMVRQEAIPLIRLHRLLRQDATDIETTRGLVVVVENCGRQYGLLVDELHGQLQVVMKSLEDNYRKIDGVSGATILGDGRVALILDIPGILRLNSRGPGAEFPALLADSSKSAGNRSNSLPPIPSASR
ncbi:MAG: chemotaxis protein CheA, partial [Pirellulaceae bacterium]